MKGLIVAAGYGTRFLPVTKTVPKEMLPIIDTPAIAFIIDEFIASGITEIVIITSRRKKCLEDYFDREVELEELFTREGATSKLAAITPHDIKVSFVRQKEMLGTGHALLQARPFLEGSPFVVAYPDDIHFGDTPLAAQLISVYEQTGCSVLATMHDPPELYSYACLSIAEDGLHVTDMVEKPAPGTAPSREASIGRYLYTPDIFDALEEGWRIHTGKEYYHVYGLKRLMERDRVVFKQLEGERFDTGTPEGFLKTLVYVASQRPELRSILKEACDLYV